MKYAAHTIVQLVHDVLSITDNHEDFVILLLKNPLTDLTKTDNDENSAQDLAKQQGHENISQLIKIRVNSIVCHIQIIIFKCIFFLRPNLSAAPICQTSNGTFCRVGASMQKSQEINAQ